MVVPIPDIDSCIQAAYTVIDDISMRVEIDKCRVLTMCRGKESECEGITIGSGEVIGEMDGDAYKYLGIMKRSDIFQEKMKISVNTEYFKRANVSKKEKKENQLKQWKEKALHGQSVRETECHNESKKWSG